MRDAYAAAVLLLENVVKEMTTLEVDLPETQYVAPGAQVAYDGEQITVHINRVFSGSPGVEDPYTQGSFVYVSIEFQVTIVRFTPDISDDGGGHVTMPLVADIQASAAQMLNDVTQMTQALINIKMSGTMCSPAVPSSVGPVTTDGPEGGVVATIGLFTMPLL